MPERYTNPTKQSMEAKKLKISYKDTELEIEYFIRRGQGKTLLYLHGGACSKDDFLEATSVKELNGYTIFAFDFPGCGNSPYPKDQKLNVDDLAEITKKIIEKLNLKNIVLIGHSMGGLVAMLYLEKYKKALAFISIEGNLAPENCVFSREVAHKAEFEEFKNKNFPKLQESLSKSENIGFQKWVKTLKKSSPQAFYDYCPSIVQYSDSGEVLKNYINLDIPTLYVYGSENTDNLKFLATMKEHNCEIAEIANSNHFPFYDNPSEFYEVIFNFLKR